MPIPLVPEDELCLLLSRGELPPDIQARALQLLAGPLCWDRIMLRAREHHVVPLLYRSLRKLDFHHVPAPARTELTEAFRVNALRNEFLSQKLIHLLRALGEGGVRVIPLKGVALSQALYGDPAFRDCSDIDLLVPENQVLLARRRIIAQGYKGVFPEEFFLRHQFPTGVDCPLNPEVQNSLFPFLVDLHWTVLHHSSKDSAAVQELWGEAEPKSLFGVSAYALSSPWEFLFLAEHAAGHKWQGLRWLADIHDLCMSVPVDWQQVKEKTDRYELEFVVSTTLAASASLFGTPIPREFSHASLPSGLQLYPNSLAFREGWNAPLFYPRLLKRTSEKLRWYADIIFVARPADRAYLRLPAALSFLYYLWRPLRLSIKWTCLFARAGLVWLRDRMIRRRLETSNSPADTWRQPN